VDGIGYERDERVERQGGNTGGRPGGTLNDEEPEIGGRTWKLRLRLGLSSVNTWLFSVHLEAQCWTFILIMKIGI